MKTEKRLTTFHSFPPRLRASVANLFCLCPRILSIAAAVCFILPWSALADSAGSLVATGNRAYQAGKYEDAIVAYDKASVKVPESPMIYFNKGDVLYRKGDYAAAAGMFEKAAGKSKDLSLEATARYNLGNCAFFEAERQKDSDLKKAIASCETSIKHYHDALKLNPDYKAAAENIEIVRVRIKSLLDEQKKKAEEADKQQKAQQETMERLKQLIEKQDKALEKNKELAKEKNEKGDSADVQKKASDQAGEQKEIQKETGKLSEQMKETAKAAQQQQQKPQNQQQQNPAEEVAKHLDNAARQQGEASDNLEKKDLEKARPEQTEASRELREAMKAMSEKKPQDQSGQNQQQDQKQQEQQQQQGEQQKKEEQQQDGGKQGEQGKEEAAAVDEQARDVLNEEKENKEMRDRQRNAQYRDVDKDW